MRIRTGGVFYVQLNPRDWIWFILQKNGNCGNLKLKTHGTTNSGRCAVDGTK